MKTLSTIVTTLFLTIALAATAFAGTWQPQSGGQWKYQNDDGSYATGWLQDEGKHYYLDADGFMLADTRTPDGYYVDASGVWDGQPPAAGVPGPGGSTTQAGLTTSTPSTVYQPGIYQVGVDIPAGEYVVLSSPGTESSYYEIRTNTDFDSYDDMIDSCTFTYNSIIWLEDGQFLGLEDCSASPIAEMPQISFMEGQMFKVGYHIPAGTYRLSMTENPENYGIWFILSAPTNTAEDVLSQANIYGGADANVTLTDGQYLQLIDCCIAE